MLSPDELTALIIDPSRTELTLVDLSALQEPLAPPTASPTAAAQDPQPRPTPKVAAHRFSARAPPTAGGQGGARARQGAAKGAGGAASAAAGGAVSEPQYEAFAAACWSPDSARVAVVCRSGNLYLLERCDAYAMGAWCPGREGGRGGSLWATNGAAMGSWRLGRMQQLARVTYTVFWAAMRTLPQGNCKHSLGMALGGRAR